MTKTKKLIGKDVAQILDVCENTGQKILKDIKKEFDIKIVTETHLKNYLKL